MIHVYQLIREQCSQPIKMRHGTVNMVGQCDQIGVSSTLNISMVKWSIYFQIK